MVLIADPALTGWANLWRAYSAGTFGEEEPRAKTRGLVALDRRSPPFAQDAKDGAPSRSFVPLRNRRTQERPASLLRRAGRRTGPTKTKAKNDPRTDLKVGHYKGAPKKRPLQRQTQEKDAGLPPANGGLNRARTLLALQGGHLKVAATGGGRHQCGGVYLIRRRGRGC
jgi:hypothetical protein